MAMIGFIFMFCVMCFCTLVMVYLMLAPEPFGLAKSDRFYGLGGCILVGLGWYWLFHDVNITVGGIG